MSLFPHRAASELTIYWDDIHEGLWFQGLHPRLRKSELEPIEGAVQRNPNLEAVLRFDRPDIVLTANGIPILVVERTVEVPSGHNVGQRYPRLAAAAQAKVPVVFIVPHMARKHGGETEGPRYMNLRLFMAFAKMADVEGTAVLSINWPVDADCEVIQSPEKDVRTVEFLNLFFELYDKHGVPDLNEPLMKSHFETEQLEERRRFIKQWVKKAARYDKPPASVRIVNTRELPPPLNSLSLNTGQLRETVVYTIGMTYIRSDPYTGSAMMYDYLYAGGPSARTRHVVLQFPQIEFAEWTKKATRNGGTKELKLFKFVADAIVFRDRTVLKADL